MSVIWQPRLDTEAQAWRATATELTRSHFAPLAAELDRDQRYPWENIKVLVEHGLAGVFIPKAYGGRGASLTATAAVVEAVGQGCASTAAILCAYQLGGFPVLLGGSEEQKKFYLGEMANGVGTSFALSERSAGSDAAAIEATAEREGKGWRLRGEKYWIGNGGASRYYVVFAKTDPKAGGRGVSAFMVDKQAEGIVIDELSDKMGIRGTQTSNLRLDAVVPADAQVGELNRALRLALQTLNVGRIMVSAQALGLALAAYREASDRALARSAFGRPIVDHQAIAFKLADMATEISATRMMLYEAARAYDAGEDVANLGAMAKLSASEAAHRAADSAVQIGAAWAIASQASSSVSTATSASSRFTKGRRKSNVWCSAGPCARRPKRGPAARARGRTRNRAMATARRRSGAEAEHTAREEIIGAAAELFMDLGYAATSIDAIAEKLGATKGRIYHYYRSKAQVFFDVQITAMKHLFAIVEPIARSGVPPEVKLEQMARAHLELILRELPIQKVSVQGLQRHVLQGGGFRQAKVLQHIAQLRDDYEQMFAEVLDEGTRRQLFDDLPPRLLSKPFFGALNWVTVWYRPRRIQTDEEIKTIVDALVAFAMRGVRKGV